MSVAALLSDKEVAHEFGLSVHTLRSARSNKPNLQMPPHIKQGGRIRYERDAVIAFLESKGLSALGPRSSRADQPEKR